MSWIRVPAEVAINADYIHELSLNKINKISLMLHFELLLAFDHRNSSIASESIIENSCITVSSLV